jgi:hypothetical protein
MRTFDPEDEEPVKIKGCEVEASTAKALLIIFPDKLKRWVPRSQITDESEVYDDFSEAARGMLVVKRWWAKQANVMKMEA